MFFGEEVSRKTHGVCFLGEKQARKHKPEANRYLPEGKVCFWRRSKQKNTNRKLQVNFIVDFCISTQIYIYKDKKRTRYGNKECYI